MNNFKIIKPMGNSMRPIITAEKDSAVIEEKEPKLYDIILFDSKKGKILHRIIKIKDENTFLVAGDHEINTEEIKKSQVLGVMTFIERNGKLISMYKPKYKIWAKIWCCFSFRKAIFKILKK